MVTPDAGLRRRFRLSEVLAHHVRPGLHVLVVAGFVLAAASLAGYYSSRATSWAVMTDELQVARLATSIAESLSPIPSIHGAYYGAHSQLYPLLLAPLYGTLSAPDAAVAARTLNALLLASAAWPAFLLARAVTSSRGAGYVAAALTAFTPWLALSSTLLTENVAYPAFVWAVLLCHRTIAEPAPGRDLAAIAGLLVAFLARTQLFVLAAALPAALVLHEVGFALRTGPARTALRRGATRAFREHHVLVGASLAGAGVAGALALGGSLGGVVGNYVVPFEGDLVPPGFWSSAVAHLDQIVVGVGVVPAVLAISWTISTVLQPRHEQAHAFAALLVVLLPLLTFEVTSFDLRFTPEQFIQERYLFYLVPLFAVGAAAWLTESSRSRVALFAFGLTAGTVVGFIGLASYDETLIFWTSPAAAFHPAVEAAATWTGLSPTTFLQLVSAVALALVGAAALTAPRVAAVGTAVLVAAFGAAQAVYVLERQAEPVMTRPHAGVRDWIDAADDDGRPVALLPGGLDGPEPWWEAELWNARADRVFRVNRGPVFTPFPVEDVAIDRTRGALVGSLPRRADLVVSETETRFRLSGRRVARNGGLVLVRTGRPYPLEWSTRGISDDGWLPAEELATIRLYGNGRAERRFVTVTIAGSRFARAPVDFEVSTETSRVEGSVDPGGARPPVQLEVCVPAEGYAPVWLSSSGRVHQPDGTAVALQVSKLSVRESGRCPAPGPVGRAEMP